MNIPERTLSRFPFSALPPLMRQSILHVNALCGAPVSQNAANMLANLSAVAARDVVCIDGVSVSLGGFSIGLVADGLTLTGGSLQPSLRPLLQAAHETENQTRAFGAHHLSTAVDYFQAAATKKFAGLGPEYWHERDGPSFTAIQRIGRLRLRQRPTALIVNPDRNLLLRIPSTSCDGAVIVMDSPTTLSLVLTPRTPKDFEAGRVLSRALSGGTVVEDGTLANNLAVSLLLAAPAGEIWSGLTHPAMATRDLFSQLLLVPAGLIAPPVVSPDPWAAITKDLRRRGEGSADYELNWPEMIKELWARRCRGDWGATRLSKGATEQLVRYAAWLRQHPAEALPPVASLLALKFTGLLNLAAGDRRTDQIHAPVAEQAVHLAKWMVSAHLASRQEMQRLMAGRLVDLNEERLFCRLQDKGPLTFRDLVRGFKCQRREVWEPILQRLLDQGKVIHEDGCYRAA